MSLAATIGTNTFTMCQFALLQLTATKGFTKCFLITRAIIIMSILQLRKLKFIKVKKGHNDRERQVGLEPKVSNLKTNVLLEVATRLTASYYYL